MDAGWGRRQLEAAAARPSVGGLFKCYMVAAGSGRMAADALEVRPTNRVVAQLLGGGQCNDDVPRRALNDGVYKEQACNITQAMPVRHQKRCTAKLVTTLAPDMGNSNGCSPSNRFLRSTISMADTVQ